jgi:type II secretory pathway pseudopilin PulG
MKKGQALIESVVAVGVVALVMTAAIALVVLSTSHRRNNFDRRKANELANYVVETVINESQSDVANFWSNLNGGSCGDVDFAGYTCNYSFTVLTQPTHTNCGSGAPPRCAELIVTITWPGKTQQNLTVRRFFSRR